MRDVAVVGLGRMGAAMATRLAQTGLAVAVWNRTEGRAHDLARGIDVEVLTHASDAAAHPVVVVSLADDGALDAAYLGPDGLVAGLAPGTVVVETSTVDPVTVVRLAAAVADAGGALLDAPVSGSVPAVLGGTLTFMVGGDAAALERAGDVIGRLGQRVSHLGASGTGAAMKLAVNSAVHTLNATVSESLALAEAAGIDRSTAYDVLLGSVVGAPFLGYKRAAFEEPHTTSPAFTLDLVAKDLDLIVALADRLDSPVPQARTSLAAAREALADGDGARDMSWLAERLRARRR